MIFISPPFGNYLHFPETMSVKGSYTLKERSGLFFQILKTSEKFKNFNDSFNFFIFEKSDYLKKIQSKKLKNYNDGFRTDRNFLSKLGIKIFNIRSSKSSW